MRFPTGVKLLDHLLGGGVPERSPVLVYGPSFLGKEHLAMQTMRETVARGVPAVLVLTNACAGDVRLEMAQADTRFEDAERAGRVWFIDTYSRSVGAEEKLPNVIYTDSAVDLNGISVALNRVQGQLIREHEQHLVLLDSASTLIVHTNAGTVFRFLQVLTGKGKRAGASVLLLLDQGMHTDAEVQMFRHLAAGVISVRGDPGRHQLLVEGLGVERNPGWIDYRLGEHGIEMTGSLAGGRIR